MTEAHNDSLKQLALEHSRIFAAIEKLRDAGMRRELIPKLVAVGDQKSGKSSVLEAISGIPFPIDEGLCTKFPIEVVQRKAPQESITVTIVPADGRISQNFNRTVPPNDPFALTAAIQEATRVILGENTTGALAKHFSEDILKITVCGPERYPVIVTDLPGLWAAGTSTQTEGDKACVEAMVRQYIREPRNALLLIITAGSHGGMQRATAEIQQASADVDGCRTLGIMTGLDRVYSDKEVMDRLNGKDRFNPQHGWHCLRNSTKDERARNVVRDTEEANYFVSNWLDIDHSNKGIHSLRSKLSALLASRIKDCLPELLKDVEKELDKVMRELAQMEPAHRTEEEQKQFLTRIAGDFERLCYEAVNGHYGILHARPIHLFFNNAQDSNQVRQDKKLQAVVRALSRSFNWVMLKRGKLTRIPRKIRRFRDPETDSQPSDCSSEDMDRLEESGNRGRQRVRFEDYLSDVSSRDTEHDDEQGGRENKTGERDAEKTADANAKANAQDDRKEAAAEPTTSQLLQKMLEGGMDFSSIATQAIDSRNTPTTTSEWQALLPHSASRLLRDDVMRKYNSLSKPVKTPRERVLKNAMKLACECRGSESLHEVNSATMSALVRQETRKWRHISMIHFNAVWEAVERFVDMALEHCVPTSNISDLKLTVIREGLRKLRQGADESLEELLECHTGMTPAFHDLIVDIGGNIDLDSDDSDPEENPSPSFLMDLFETEILEKTLPSVGTEIMKKVCERIWVNGLGFGWSPTTLVAKSIFNKIEEQLQNFEISSNVTGDSKDMASQEMEREAAGRAVDHMETYYALSIQSFLSYANAIVVQNGLLRKLPLQVFSPKIVAELNTEVVAKVAGPRQSDEDKRIALETRQDLLEQALSALQTCLSGPD